MVREKQNLQNSKSNKNEKWYTGMVEGIETLNLNIKQVKDNFGRITLGDCHNK